MGIPVKTPTIERHPLRDAYMVVAPEEVNPMGIPFIGTRQECEKSLAHMKKKLVADGYELADVGFCKLARAYAKEHKIIALEFRRGRNSGDLFAIAVKEEKNHKGHTIYNFGRLYHVFGTECVYDQCGCNSFTDGKEVRLAAYRFFGIDTSKYE